MRRSTLLFSAAAIALVIGGWPALSRVYHSYVQRQEQAARQQQLSQETAQLKAELQTSKPALLAELQQLQAAGMHQEVLAKASRYRLTNDPDIGAIYRRSAQELSLQQTLAKLERLAAEHCNEADVRRHLQETMSKVQSAGTASNSSTWTIRRLDTDAFIAPIQSHLRAAAARSKETEEHEHEHEHDSHIDSVEELFDVDHPARLSPALAYALMQGNPVGPQICVWSVQGEAALGALTQNAAKPFELTIWMAASATERSMEYNVLRIQGF